MKLHHSSGLDAFRLTLPSVLLLDRAEAQRLNNMGKVVYGVYKSTEHGHIITVRTNNGPNTGSNGPNTGSGLPSTGPNVPILNDIGRTVTLSRSQQQSSAFRNGMVFYAPNQ